jgi:hypothetical protein
VCWKVWTSFPRWHQTSLGGLRNFIRRATPDELLEQFQELQRRLAETQATLRALQTGEGDAIVVATSDGHRVFFHKGAYQAYRLWIQSMAEEALTLNSDGLIRDPGSLTGLPPECALLNSRDVNAK